MTKTDTKIEALLAKHPNLTKEEAITILAEKNKRKSNKRKEKADRFEAKIAKRKEEKEANEEGE